MHIKKVFSFIVFVPFFINVSSAQEIPFPVFKGGLNEAIPFANNHYKNVLLYFTAKWCGPCIQMQKEVFPKATVKDFINSRYVFLKIDIDIPDNNAVANKYFSGSIPEFCILDSLGNKQFSFVGYQSEIDLLRLLREGLSPESTAWKQHTKRFNAGERSVSFLKKYLDTLEYYNDPLADSIYTILLSNVDNDDIQSRYMMNKMTRYIKNKESRDYRFLLKNKNTLSDIYGPELIDELLFRPWNIALENAAIMGDKTSFVSIAKEVELLNINKIQIENYLYYGEKTLLLKSKDYKNYISLIESDKYPSVFNNDRFNRKEDVAITIVFSQIDDEILLTKAKEWIEESLLQDTTSKKLSIAGQIEEKLGNKSSALKLYNISIEQYQRENPSSSVPPGLQSLVDNLKNQ